MKYKFIVIAVIALCFCLGTVANAQLKITITSEKTTYKLGEPVLVYVNVQNIGRQSVKLYSEVEPDMTEYVYYVTGADGKEIVYSPISIGEPSNLVTLEKNESLSGTAELFFGGGEYYFEKPGKYNIKVKHGETVSPPFTIAVQKPESDAEKEVAKMVFGSKEMGFYYEIGGSDELKEANKIIDQLIKEHSNSAVSDYFAIKRANNLSVHARNFAIKKPRTPKYDDALNILNKIKDKKMPLLYKSRIAKSFAKIYKNTNRKADAVKELEQFKSTLDKQASFKKFFIKDVEKHIELMNK